MTQYILFTLNTTQEVIAELVKVNDDENSYHLRKPRLITPVQTGQDTYGLRLDPVSMADPDGDQLVNITAIAMEAVNIPDGLVRAYQQQTSNIEIVSSLPGQM